MRHVFVEWPGKITHGSLLSEESAPRRDKARGGKCIGRLCYRGGLTCLEKKKSKAFCRGRLLYKKRRSRGTREFTLEKFAACSH